MNEATALQTQQTALTVEDSRQAAQLEAVKQIILQRTPDNEIRYRPGRGGVKFKYTDGAYVIRTLNAAFGHRWNFEADNEEIINWNGVPFEVRCRGRLTVPIAGEMVTKMQFGSQVIEFQKDGKPVTIGDAFKGAATDAMKKCASLLGVALDLYDSDYKAENYEDSDADTSPQNEADRSDPRPKTLGDLVSPKQLWMIRNMAREQGVDADEICRAKFGCTMEEISKKSASAIIDQLKANEAAMPVPPIASSQGPSKNLMTNPRHTPEMANRLGALVRQLTIRKIPPDEILRETNVALHDSNLGQVQSRYELDEKQAAIACQTFEAWITVLDRAKPI